jgi:hypothetical protein
MAARPDQHRAPAGADRPPTIAEFKDALDTVNALTEASAGLVWRLQDELGNATSIEVDAGDELLIPNMSLWESIETLSEFVYRSDHTPYLRRRREWFEWFDSVFLALWWVPRGQVPTLAEAKDRLALLDRDGPTPDAFTFRHRYRRRRRLTPSTPSDTPGRRRRDPCAPR